MKDRVFTNKSLFNSTRGVSTTSRVITASGYTDKSSTFRKVRETLLKHCEKCLISMYSSPYDTSFEVCIDRSGEIFRIAIESCSPDSFNYERRLIGQEISEVISTQEGNRDLLLNQELLQFVNRRVMGGGSSTLFRLVNDGGFLQMPYNKGESWVDDFYFPPSLYRVSMDQYFEDPCNPTREEFILAITSEGIHATTEEEKQAIKEAEIYVSRHSLLPYKG